MKITTIHSSTALPRPAMSAPAPQVSRIAAARRAELDEMHWVNPNAHAPAPGGAAAAAAFPTHPLDSALAALGQLPAILAEPVRAQDAVVAGHSRGGTVECFGRGRYILAHRANLRAPPRGGCDVSVCLDLCGQEDYPKADLRFARRPAPNHNCEEELAAAAAIFGANLAGAMKRLDRAAAENIARRRLITQAKDEATRLRHLTEAQAAEIAGLRQGLGKRKRGD